MTEETDQPKGNELEDRVKKYRLVFKNTTDIDDSDVKEKLAEELEEDVDVIDWEVERTISYISDNPFNHTQGSHQREALVMVKYKELNDYLERAKNIEKNLTQMLEFEQDALSRFKKPTKEDNFDKQDRYAAMVEPIARTIAAYEVALGFLRANFPELREEAEE